TDVTRLSYEDADGNSHTVATLEDDGLRFSGNDNSTTADGYVTHHLNEEMQIVGGANATNADGTDSDYSSDNIRTVATQDGGIEIQLAESPTFGGDLTVEGDTYLGDNFEVVNNEAFYDGPITENTHIVNKEYVDNQGDASEGGGFGLADAGDAEVKQDLGATIKVFDPDGDITTTADNANGELLLGLSSDLSVGGPGEPGEPGEDGYIGVDGADGVAGVGIDGSDGSIGLTGSAGADGVSPELTMRPTIEPGDVVADTTDVTRLSYEDADGNSHTVATLEDDGLRFSGNDNSTTADGYVTRHLNEEMQIVGGANATNADGTDSDYSSDNIRTVATQDGGIEIQLAESPTFGGDLTVEGDTYLGDNFSVVNNEAFYDGPITENAHIVNKQYVDGLETHYYSVNDGGTQQDNYANDGAEGVDSLAAGVAAFTGAERAVALGYNTSAIGVDSVAIGQYASATAEGSVAIGRDATANGGKAVSIGYGNTATGDGAVAIGDPSTAIGDGALALGKDNYAEGTGAVALGNTNTSEGDGALAIGDTNISSGNGAITMGVNNQAIGEGAVAMGNDNLVSGDGAFAVGNNATSGALDTLALGTQASATAQHAMALGNSSEASGLNSFAAGNTAVASAKNSMALGQMSLATGLRASAIGLEAVASAEGALSVGTQTEASGLRSTSIGNRSVAAGQGSSAIGSNADAQAFGSMAIGARSTAMHEQSIALGGASQTVRGPQDDYVAYGLDALQTSKGELAIGQVAVFDEDGNQLTEPGERQITGVAAGSADTDAVNVSQLKAVNETANAGWDLSAQDGTASNVAPGGEVNLRNADGNLTVTQATNNGREEVTFDLANSLEVDSVTTGDSVMDTDGLTVDDGAGNVVTTTATGTTVTDGTTTTEVTAGGVTSGNITVDGSSNKITGVADGDVNETSTDVVNGSQLWETQQALEAGQVHYYSVNDGGTQGGNYDNDGADGNNAIAAGVNASATADGAIAMGDGATASEANSVAIGAGATTEAAVGTADITIGGQTYVFAGISPIGTFSVGSAGAERTITHVAAGRVTADSTDAVNGSQLYATNQAVGGIDDRVTNVEGDITNLDGRVTNVEGDVTQLDNRVTNVEGDITNLGDNLAELDDRAVKYDIEEGNVNYDSITLAGDDGTTITNVADGDVSEDSSDAVNGSQLWEVQEQLTTINEGGSKYFKANSEAAAAQAEGAESIAMGPESVAQGDHSVAAGDGAVAESEGGVALGAGSQATREGMNGAEEAFSGESVASTQGAVSVGSEGGERQITNVAGGTEATDAVNVRQLEAVQAGAVNYDRNEDGSLDYGSVTLGQEGTPTQIHNVAAGELPTDAANVGQLQALNQQFQQQIGGLNNRIKDVHDQANAGTASAIAAASVPQAYLPGKSMISAGAGTYNGESAVSVGASRLSDNGRWAVKLNFTGDSQGNFGAGVGAGFHW
ncbi:YadA-like family protein, partial [Halomonas sp. THAF12]|uniref:YadA-like family protein n=1 Tax=Halomonas sp. B23F22_10 TaxID=3459515 RepID=UPI00373E0F99